MMKIAVLAFLSLTATVLAKPQLPGITLPGGITYTGTGSLLNPLPIPALNSLLGANLPGIPVSLIALNIDNIAAVIAAKIAPPGATPAQLAQIAAVVKLYLNEIIKDAATGATINFINGQLTIGTVALPSYLTCQTAAASLAACHICNYDCVYVHNTYGGKCAKDDTTPTTQTTGAKGFDCVCQTTPNANGTITDSSDICGPITGALLDPEVQYVIRQFLLARELELCVPVPAGNKEYLSGGCTVDCAKNHQYQSGVCKWTNRIPFSSTETLSTNPEGTYCICSFGPDGQPTQDQPPTPTPTPTST